MNICEQADLPKNKTLNRGISVSFVYIILLYYNILLMFTVNVETFFFKVHGKNFFW